MKHAHPLIATIPEQAPPDSWWICDRAEFSRRLARRAELMRLSRLGQTDSPSYAPSVFPQKRRHEV